MRTATLAPADFSHTGRRWGVLFATGATLFALALPNVALAERYRVDLILYGDKTGSGSEVSVRPSLPDLTRVIELSDSAQLRSAGIEILPDEVFGLSREWRRLANSQRHQPLLRLAWIQKDPPSENGPGLRLRSGTPQVWNSSGAGGARSAELYPVDGSVRLLMSRFLHLDADLGYTITRDNGELGSFRLQERRRLRRDELHHMDSPRMGLLVRVQKMDSGEKSGK